MLKMVDCIEDSETNKYIVTKKLTSISEEVFESHFPHYPILPAVLILANVEQSIRLFLQFNGEEKQKLRSFRKMKLYLPIRPGNVIITRIDVDDSNEERNYIATVRNQNNELVTKITHIVMSKG